jgi:hypothetical protein
MSILKLDTINLKNLKISEPLEMSNYYIVNHLYYETKPLLFQTPKINLAFNPSPSTKLKSHLITLSIPSYPTLEPTNIGYKLIELIHSIDDLATNYIKKKKLEGYSMKPSINYHNNIPYWYLKLPNSNPNIFDSEKKKQPIEKLVKNSYVLAIVYPLLIYINHKEKTYGVSWEIEQLKFYLPISHITECLIDDNLYQPKPIIETIAIIDNSIETKIKEMEEHVKLGKYFKMLRLGIPLVAVEQKMRMSGDNPEELKAYDISVLKKKPKSLIEESTPLPTIKLPSPLELKQQLAKIQEKPIEKPIERPVFKMPSPMELAGMLNKLKKVN